MQYIGLGISSPVGFERLLAPAAEQEASGVTGAVTDGRKAHR